MYIETRIYADGTAKAKYHKGWGYPKLEPGYDKCTFILESIAPENHCQKSVLPGESPDNTEPDYNSLEEWIEEMLIELDDIVPIVIKLQSGEWVDITKYVNKEGVKDND